MNHDDQPSPASAPLCVLYDGACPLCRREIALYRGLPAVTPVRFTDVSAPGAALPPGVTRAELLARFHVQRPDGRLESGARAFLTLWSALPGWRWLALAGRLPGVAEVAEAAYRVFLRLRPGLQRWAARLDPPGTTASEGTAAVRPLTMDSTSKELR
jgi:predicted DCC family thiol-disulfide oxidoreductase YuxK